MNKLKNNPMKLINKYTQEVVFTRDYNDIVKEGANEFIRVFNETNPKRTYLVNRNAFNVVK
jgi:hypothetical protein